MKSPSLKTVAIIGAVGVSLAALAIIGRRVNSAGKKIGELEQLTNPNALGLTGNPVTDVVKGARQITTRTDEIPEAVGYAVMGPFRWVENALLEPARKATDVRNMESGRMTRAIRNNNPGNIVKSAISWRGKVNGADTRFETFDTMANGARACVLNVAAKWNDGPNQGPISLATLVAIWAPNHENDTGAYQNFVARETGRNMNEILNPANKEQMVSVCRAIAIMESGYASIRNHAPELADVAFWEQAYAAAFPDDNAPRVGGGK